MDVLKVLIVTMLMFANISFANTLPKKIEKQIIKTHGKYRLTKSSDYSKIFLKLKKSAAPVKKIDLNLDGINDLLISILTNSNKHLLLAGISNKNGKIKLIKLHEAKPDKLICSSWSIKEKGMPGISDRKYFYYNFKSHHQYGLDPRPKTFWQYIDSKKMKYKNTISIEINLPLNSCSQAVDDDLFYASTAYFYTKGQLKSYDVID